MYPKYLIGNIVSLMCSQHNVLHKLPTVSLVADRKLRKITPRIWCHYIWHDFLEVIVFNNQNGDKLCDIKQLIVINNKSGGWVVIWMGW